MKFGIWTPLPHVMRAEPRMEASLRRLDEGGEDDGAFEFALDVVARAESYGFHNTLVAERFLGPDLEAWTLAAALAARTQSIELMVAVHPGVVTPQVVAKMAASIDRISHGRCALNIVNGHWAEEFDLFGNGAWLADPEARYRRMREFILVIDGLWRDPAFQFAGEFYKADLPAALANTNQRVVVPEFGKPQVRAHGAHTPPLYAASRSAPGKAIIAEHCDVWFAEYKPGYRNFEDNLEKIRRDIAQMTELAARCGRRIGFGLNPLVICEATQDAAQRLADAIEDPANKDRISNSLGAGLVGTPEVIAQRIARLEEAGVDHLMLRFTPMLDGLARFGEKVMPLLQSRG